MARPESGRLSSLRNSFNICSFSLCSQTWQLADFNKTYVGQGEEMVNGITERCVLLWELCVLFIDEIDGLAPNRKENRSLERIPLCDGRE